MNSVASSLTSLIFPVLVLCTGCQSLIVEKKTEVGKQPLTTPVEHDSSFVQIADELFAKQLSPKVWRYVSKGSADKECNGLLVSTTDGSILIDVPLTAAHATKLFLWARQSLKAPIRHVLVSHLTNQKLGALRVAIEKKILIHAHKETEGLFSSSGLPPPQNLLTSRAALEFGGRKLDIYYPGQGCAPENLVIWLEEEKLLFGSCLVLAQSTAVLPHAPEQDITSWRSALLAIRKEYPATEIIVPEQGEPDSSRLVNHTLRLLRSAQRR